MSGLRVPKKAHHVLDLGADLGQKVAHHGRGEKVLS